jgi:hypothetical protein
MTSFERLVLPSALVKRRLPSTKGGHEAVVEREELKTWKIGGKSVEIIRTEVAGGYNSISKRICYQTTIYSNCGYELSTCLLEPSVAALALE